MVGDVNVYMNDPEDPLLAEIEIMIAEPKRYSTFWWHGICDLETVNISKDEWLQICFCIWGLLFVRYYCEKYRFCAAYVGAYEYLVHVILVSGPVTLFN